MLNQILGSSVIIISLTSLIGLATIEIIDLVRRKFFINGWAEYSRAEVVTRRIDSANKLKGKLLSEYDILTKWMKMSPEEATQHLEKIKKQKIIEELKLQVLAENPMITGIRIDEQFK